jgi:hypothetical protein
MNSGNASNLSQGGLGQNMAFPWVFLRVRYLGDGLNYISCPKEVFLQGISQILFHTTSR